MDAAEARDRVVKLAKEDTGRAVAVAREITDAWYRAQAFAWAARFASDTQLPKLCEESFLASRSCSDAYQRIGSTAWGLRALIERGDLQRAEKESALIIPEILIVEPTASRSEAAFLLFQATIDLEYTVRESLLRELQAASEATSHWRAQRNLIDAVSMLAKIDARLSEAAIQSIKDDKIRRKAQSTKNKEPRLFFW